VARKRKSGLLQNVFELVAMLPWWIGVLTAIGLYLGLHLYASQPVAPATTKTQIASSISTTFFVTVAGVLQYVLPLVCLAAAAASAWRASKRKSLVQGVTSSRSAASLDAMTWQEFELLVGAAFRQKGYKVTELGGAGPDGGVDLLLVKGGETTPLTATSNSPARGHPKFPQAARSDYDASALMAMRAAASLSL